MLRELRELRFICRPQDGDGASAMDGGPAFAKATAGRPGCAKVRQGRPSTLELRWAGPALCELRQESANRRALGSQNTGHVAWKLRYVKRKYRGALRSGVRRD